MKKIKIVNKRGLHARASAKFVKLAETFSSEIEVSKDGITVCGTSIMGLMLLVAALGDFIHISISGDDQKEAMAKIETLIKNKFEEDV